jgi:hypothetical protein
LSFLINSYRYPTAETPVFLSAYAVNGTISTTTNLDDTFTGTTSGSWGKSCSGVETDGVEFTVHNTTEYWYGGVTIEQGTYGCGAETYPTWNWFVNGTSAYMYACLDGTPATFGSVTTVNVNTIYRIIRTADTIKYYLDIDGTDSWTLKYTHTDTGNIPIVYVAAFIGVQNSYIVMSTI